MDIWQNIILAIVQGLTEFLPVSSSGHLALISHFFGWKFDLTTDLAFHLGSLGAVLVWAATKIKSSPPKAGPPLAEKPKNSWSSLVFYILNSNFYILILIAVAAVPALVVGAILGNKAEIFLSRLEIIASALILFSPILWWAERRTNWSNPDLIGTNLTNLPADLSTEAQRAQVEALAKAGWSNLSARQALSIGLWQILAFIPGISRSGATAAGGLFAGLSKEKAVEFSFLLFIPVIGAAAVAQTFKIIANPISQIGLIGLIWPVFASFLFSWLGLRLFLGLTQKIGFGPIIIYRVLLGLLIFGGLLVEKNMIK